MHVYIFTAGNDLDRETSEFLAYHGVNVTMSLLGNPFIDADFFNGKQYPKGRMVPRKLQNQAAIANNLRYLIGQHQGQCTQPSEGIVRLAMNYVLTEADLRDASKVRELKQAAEENNIAFVCNLPFEKHPEAPKQAWMEKLAAQINENRPHSTYVKGCCQMGAGSSATVDYDGRLFRCPYMTKYHFGNFLTRDSTEKSEILARFLRDKRYICTLRETKRK